MKKLLVGLSVGMSLGVLAASYDATTDWASVSSAGYEDGTGDLTAAHGWTNTAGAATVKGEVILVDDEETGGELVYGPAAPLAVNATQTAYLHFPMIIAGGDLAEPAAGTLANIAVVSNDVGADWYGWSASGWTKLTGTVPEGACDVRIELDNRNDERKVRYSVKTSGDDDYVVLTAGGEGWLTAAASSRTSISEVAFTGKTALTGVELTQTGTVTVNDTRLAKSGITAAQLGENGENGIPNWENLVLGLSCKEKSSIPVVRPVQTADASHVTLKLGGVNIDTASGATVKYRVHSASCLVPGASGDVSEWKAANEVAAMALPGTGVRYYQMEVVTTPGN